ncbi:MAG: metallophosphoesterase, partial [Actinomycetales bacterium]
VARAVVPAGLQCPSLQVTDSQGNPRAVAMRERQRPKNTGSAFAPLAVCSTPVPVGAVSANIAGYRVPAAMPGRVKQIAMLGDSGCRVTTWEVQACSDPAQWPLARVSASIAADRPDVIIINGDFFYRESSCPVNEEDFCAASPGQVPGLPFTDSAYGWLADVFIPMAPMLATAPLVVVRGNHEACNRGGNGYFYFFDPRQDTANTCAPTIVDGILTAAPTVPTPTYPIDLRVSSARTLQLAIVDSSGGNDPTVSPYSVIQRPAYQQAAAITAKRPGRESWLLTHRPIFGFASNVFDTPSEPIVWGSADQAAAAWGLLGTYDLIFSSHMHIAEVVQLPGLPAQLILGNAGTELDPSTGYVLPNEGFNVGPDRTYPVPSSAWVDVRFGYAMAEPGKSPHTWRLQMRDPQGAAFATCGLRATRLYCRAVQ